MRPESKKPRLVAEAKCLIILVGRQRFELWTYGLRVPNFRHYSALIAIREFAKIA